MKPVTPAILVSACVAAAPSAQVPPLEDSLARPGVFPDVPPDRTLGHLRVEAAGAEPPPPLPGAWDAVAATMDSTSYFQTVEALAFTFAERGSVANAANALFTLRRLGARRPYLRNLALAPTATIVLAAAATSVLADDPRPSEGAELESLARVVFETSVPNAQPYLSAVSDYNARLWQVTHFEALATPSERLTYLIENVEQGWARSRLREAYQSDPSGVRAAVEAYAPPVPPTDAPPSPLPLSRSAGTAGRF